MVRWKCSNCSTWIELQPKKVKCPCCNVRSKGKYQQSIDDVYMNGDLCQESYPQRAHTHSEFRQEVQFDASQTLGATSQEPAGTSVQFDRQESQVDIIHEEIDKREAELKMTQIRDEFSRNGTTFTDTAFPANETSIYFPNNGTSARQRVHWLRPENIQFDRDCGNLEWCVFRNPTAADIEQGTLGNCWFLSALAVVAERQELIDKIILTKEYQRCGAYQIRLCHGGQWKIVTVDDLLPCDNFNFLLYSQSRRKQLWVPLIEKAAAKLHGCYEALIAGHCIESLNMLTGAPCETLTIADFDEELLWAQLLSNYEQKYIFGASSGSGSTAKSGEPTEEDYARKGLKKKHAYSILDIKDVEGHRLIKLKNPWARVNWTGDWSHDSDLWQLIPQRKRREMKDDNMGEGVFWMCIGDFMHFFTSIDVCRLRSSEWSEIRLPCHLPSQRMFQSASGDQRLDSRRIATSVKVAIITVFQNTEMEFVLQQAPVRHSSNLSLVDLGLLIFRGNVLDSPQPKLVYHSRRMIRLVTSLHTILEPDIYSIVRYSFAPWLLSSNNPAIDSVITIHSRGTISMMTENMTEACLRKSIISLVVEKGQQLKGRAGMTAYYLTKGWCGMLLVVENLMQSMYLHVECDCSESQNVVSSRGELRTFDSVPPLSRQLIIVLTQLEIYERFTVSHRLLHRNSYNSFLGDWGRKSRSQHDPSIEGILHEAIEV